MASEIFIALAQGHGGICCRGETNMPRIGVRVVAFVVGFSRA